MSFENINIREILDEEGLGYHENKKHFILEECPTCGKKDKLYIDKAKKLWICYACVGPGNAKDAEVGKGNMYAFLEALGWSGEAIRNRLRGSNLRPSGDLVPEKIVLAPIEKPKDDRVFESFELPKRFIRMDCTGQQMGVFTHYYKYLWSRKFMTREQYLRWRPMFDPKAKRVVFPCRTMDGTIVGFQARDATARHLFKHPRCPNFNCELRWKTYFTNEDWAPSECPACGSELKEFNYPKSLNNSDLPKSDFFFGEDTVDWSRPVVLVEGPFDATNVRNSIALLGKSLSEVHLKLLLDRVSKLIIYFDGDNPGIMAASSVYEQVRPFLDIQMVKTPTGKDPGSFSLEENDKIISQAMNPSLWHQENGLVAL